ncbi:unnamed protein product [Cercospora beticola]|nr:unnamed protein product [Cercospora beticola]
MAEPLQSLRPFDPSASLFVIVRTLVLLSSLVVFLSQRSALIQEQSKYGQRRGVSLMPDQDESLLEHGSLRNAQSIFRMCERRCGIEHSFFQNRGFAFTREIRRMVLDLTYLPLSDLGAGEVTARGPSNL